MSKLMFSGETALGDLNMDIAEMVCVPSKPHYAEVDLCLRSGDDGKSGMNLCVGQVVGNWLSFEEKKKLGYEIAERWNRAAPQENNEGGEKQQATANK